MAPATFGRDGELDPSKLRDYAQRLADEGSGKLEPPPELVRRAEEIARRALETLPSAAEGLEAFFAHLGGVLPAGEGRSEALGALCVEDLYLAFACSRHDGDALRAFERTAEPELRLALGRLRVPDHQHDDLRQRLWEKLFVAGRGQDKNERALRPKILEYSGRGKLRFWFRVAAMRFVLDEIRQQRGRSEEPLGAGGVEIAASESDPELELLKRKYSREFALAFEQATAALAAEDRNVLRSYYTKQMTIDEIAVGFGIHRATAARRVQRARGALLSDTRRRLSRELGLSDSELASVLRLIESRLHVSLHRLLA